MLITLCILFASATMISSKVDKYVKIKLDAKWTQTPIHIEASEFIAGKGNSKFWEFVELMHAKSAKTDKEVYDHILNAASEILKKDEVDTLKFSLSIRSHSPKVKLFQHIALENKPECALFYQVKSGKITCNIEDALSLDSSEDSSISSVKSFDHIYPGSEANQHIIIVYADFMSKDFGPVYQNMLLKVKNADVKFMLRHYYQTSDNSSKVALSGYGVELAVKSTEYKAVDDQKVKDAKGKGEDIGEVGDDEVEGFLFKRLRELHPHSNDNLDQFKAHLKESNKELAELRVWQLQDLSFQAAQRVMSASSQDVMNVLKDLSQNVPMVARSLVKASVSDDLRKEVKKNQIEFEKRGIAPGQSSFFINGIEVPVDMANPFKLLSIFDSETLSMSLLANLDLEMEKAGELISLNVKPEQETFIIDTRSESVQWLNDLEKDSQYNYWPSQLQEILRPTFPGMLRYIAKNIFHVIAYVNPTSKDGIKLLSSMNEMVEHSIPARFGVVFVANGSVKDDIDDNVAAGIIRAFSFIKSDKSLKEAFKFLNELYAKASWDVPSSEILRKQFLSWYHESELEESLGADSEYDDLRRISKLVFDSTGLKSLPQILVNGEQLDKEEMLLLENSVTDKILGQTNAIQQAVYMGTYYSYPTIYDYVMSQPNVVRRLNSLIQTVKGTYINFGKFNGDLPLTHEHISSLSKEEAATALMNSAKYFIQDNGATTIWVVADSMSEDGLKLVKNVLSYLKKVKNARLAIILHGNVTTETNSNDVLQMVLFLRQKLISAVAKLMLKLLDLKTSLPDLVKKEDELKEVVSGITGINKKKLLELFSSTEALVKVKEIIHTNSLLVQQAFGIKAGENVVISNGRIMGPLKDEDVLVSEDFELLQSFENNRCGFKISEVIKDMKLSNMPRDGHDRYRSDIMMKVASILSQRDDQVRTTPTYKNDKHSVIKIKPRFDRAAYDLVAILDPLSKDAQKLIPIISVLHDSFNANLKIFLNCKAKHSELPVKRFYRYVMQPELSFNSDGLLLNDQSAMFSKLPHSALLTLIMDTPQSWMIEATGANQDLDNIHLAEAGEMVYGDYELENIIVEGHCSDMSSAQAPRGVQFILGTQDNPEMSDTIVMANLGYFQLKAFPGSFVLQLRGGLSSEIYEIENLDGGSPLSGNQNYTVIVDSFKGPFLKVGVKRRPGKETADILDGGKEEEDFSIWGSIANYVTNEPSSKNTDGKIHIFSVCTGLLYERFLRIMMLSVLKHTKTPVKFWFLKNYLSAGLIKFLPYYAEKHKFEYELVQYKWPEWLNGQTEKQRIIWGYKILFLDVLFPLNLHRIIFVDADQIVRTDLKELMDMDLDGAPYAYTPFCNDRPEVEGFRFWNHGYWRNHLAGRPYHISALYVVDLKRFRRVAAGDRLRGQYQGLSQDPNSLANLDQDLPNNMIHQVQIKSLPQEWLWCETWCTDESKKNAKTIDMCNNPQTKEPKLQRAMRIAPEWTVYDDQIKALQEEFTNKSNKPKEKIPESTAKVEL